MSNRTAPRRTQVWLDEATRALCDEVRSLIGLAEGKPPPRTIAVRRALLAYRADLRKQAATRERRRSAQ